jgi:hypothetical protein
MVPLGWIPSLSFCYVIILLLTSHMVKHADDFAKLVFSNPKCCPSSAFNPLSVNMQRMFLNVRCPLLAPLITLFKRRLLRNDMFTDVQFHLYDHGTDGCSNERWVY